MGSVKYEGFTYGESLWHFLIISLYILFAYNKYLESNY